MVLLYNSWSSILYNSGNAGFRKWYFMYNHNKYVKVRGEHGTWFCWNFNMIFSFWSLLGTLILHHNTFLEYADSLVFLLQLKRELMLLSVAIGTACSGYCLIALSLEVNFFTEKWSCNIKTIIRWMILLWMARFQYYCGCCRASVVNQLSNCWWWWEWKISGIMHNWLIFMLLWHS